MAITQFRISKVGEIGESAYSDIDLVGIGLLEKHRYNVECLHIETERQETHNQVLYRNSPKFLTPVPFSEPNSSDQNDSTSACRRFRKCRARITPTNSDP
jgi:hypothetical protein